MDSSLTTPYTVLKLAPSASLADVNTAYTRIARLHNLDKSADSDKHFRLAQVAHAYLTGGRKAKCDLFRKACVAEGVEVVETSAGVKAPDATVEAPVKAPMNKLVQSRETAALKTPQDKKVTRKEEKKERSKAWTQRTRALKEDVCTCGCGRKAEYKEYVGPKGEMRKQKVVKCGRSQQIKQPEDEGEEDIEWVEEDSKRKHWNERGNALTDPTGYIGSHAY